MNRRFSNNPWAVAALALASLSSAQDVKVDSDTFGCSDARFSASITLFRLAAFTNRRWAFFSTRKTTASTEI